MEDMKKIKKLVGGIPSSPYGWKMTSDIGRNAIIAGINQNREYILNLELNAIVEGELYSLDDTNMNAVFEALRSLKKVMMDKYVELKNQDKSK